MHERLTLVAVTGMLVALVSACGTTPTGGTSEPSAAPSSSTSTLPPRPREIDLTGVDTCTLLTPEQQQQLGFDKPPKSSTDTDRYGNTYCQYGKRLSSPRFGYSIKVVTQEDATVYLTDQRDAVARVVTAAGFPAVENRPPADERGCFVDVSTKYGQYLSIQYAESTGSDDTPEVACDKARVAAEMATQTLLTQR